MNPSIKKTLATRLKVIGPESNLKGPMSNFMLKNSLVNIIKEIGIRIKTLSQYSNLKLVLGIDSHDRQIYGDCPFLIYR